MYTEHNSYKNIIRRLAAVLLLASLLCPMLMIIVSATESTGQTVLTDEARFLTAEIDVKDALATVKSQGAIKLSITGNSPKISMKINPLKAKTQANALRIVMKNLSNLNEMKIDYEYKENTGYGTINSVAATSVALEKRNDALEYIVPVSGADSMINLQISFVGEASAMGDIELISIGAVSYNFDNRTYVGAISASSYDSATKKANLAGSVSYETTLENPDAKIVLYRLAQEYDIDAVVENVNLALSYVASLPMTLSFNFTWDVKDTTDLCSRYFAAVLTKNNEVLPLTPETYLQINTSKDYVDGKEGNDFFKGIETTLYAGASENGTSIAFVDVYLDRLKSNSGDGFQYILDDGKKYYFDRLYVEEIDAIIKSYSLEETTVYLRLLLGSYDASFVSANDQNLGEGGRYFAINPYSDDAVDAIYAYSDFITSRYSSDSYGSLKGIILGRSVNNRATYNYCDAMPMNEYSDMIARLYLIVKNALDKNDKNLEIVLPLSDSIIGKQMLVDAESRDDEYPSNLFAESVVDMVTRYGMSVSSLHFMLESEHLPLCVSGLGEDSEEFIGADNVELFINAIKGISDEYSSLGSDIMFCWFPHAEIYSYELLASYMYNYNVLACTEGIRGYVISIFEKNYSLETEPVTIEQSIYATIKSTYKYADTYNNEGVSITALDASGREKWNDVVAGYSLEKVAKRTLHEANAEYVMPEYVVGSYKIWDFSSASGYSNWRVYNGCESLSVYTPSENLSRALVASFNSDTLNKYGADYGSFIYHAEGSLLMRDISSMSFDIMVPSELAKDLSPNSMFEVKITIGSGSFVSETTGVVKSDVATQLFVDTSDIDEAEYIKVSLRSLDGEIQGNVKMCINSVSIHSGVYNDKELEDIVLSGELTGADGINLDSEIDVATVVAIITVVCVLAVIFFWLMFVLRRQKNKR